MERVDVLLAMDGATRAILAPHLVRDHLSVGALPEHLGADGAPSARGLLFDGTRPGVPGFDSEQALAARRLGTVQLLLVLAADDEDGARWISEGADDYATTAEALVWRLHARLRWAARTPDRTVGSLSLLAAAELVLVEVERSLHCDAVEVGVASGGSARIFSRWAGGLAERSEPVNELLRLGLGREGGGIWGAGGAPVGEAVRRQLDARQAASLVTLSLCGPRGAPACALAYLSGPPLQRRLDALVALQPTLSAALSGAVPLEQAYIDRLRALLESNRRLRELNHAKDDLLAACAHDLRSPLNALLGHARLLADGRRGELGAAARAGVEAMRRQAQRMLELVSSLLDWRAVETGCLELRREEVDLAGLLDECVEESLPTAQQKGIGLTVGGAAAGLTMAVDPVRVREAISNLLSNAVKYTHAGGRVELVLCAEKSGARILVRDNGPGIAPDELPLIFERYRRGRAGRAHGPGVGLGLAMARELIRLHGGTIGVQSTLGAGTCFTVYLPAGAQPQAQAPGPHERARILVVEDDADLREVMIELLHDRFEVIEAHDGEDGVQKAREVHPDLVLMDLFMPQMDGFAALEDLRRDPRTLELPVIFLSGQNDESVKVRALDQGAADYLVKPFSPRELVARVERVLKGVEQRSALKAMVQVDALTGLPNFGAFRTRLEDELKRARRYATPLSAVMIDLDDLKGINDRFGHEVGNRAIVALAEHVRGQLRGSDFAARYGGDEFVVLLPHTRAEEAGRFAERIRTGLSQIGLATSKEPLPLRASFGVAALALDRPASPDALIRDADEALYRAKHRGRDQVCMSQPEADETARQPSAG